MEYNAEGQLSGRLGHGGVDGTLNLSIGYARTTREDNVLDYLRYKTVLSLGRDLRAGEQVSVLQWRA